MSTAMHPQRLAQIRAEREAAIAAERKRTRQLQQQAAWRLANQAVQREEQRLWRERQRSRVSEREQLDQLREDDPEHYAYYVNLVNEKHTRAKFARKNR